MTWYPGRCRDCAQPAEDGAARCAVCAKVHARREKVRRDARRAAGRCVVCGERAARSGGVVLTLCPEHREYYRARKAGAA